MSTTPAPVTEAPTVPAVSPAPVNSSPIRDDVRPGSCHSSPTTAVSASPAVTDSSPKNGHNSRCDAPPSNANDDRPTLKKVADFYGTPCEAGNKVPNADRQKPVAPEKPKDKHIEEFNAKNCNQTCPPDGTSFPAFPLASNNTTVSDKATNSLDGRNFPPMNHDLPAVKIGTESVDEKYSKNKRFKCTSPVKSRERDSHVSPKYDDKTKNNVAAECAKKSHPDRDDRHQFKELNLEQSLMKVKRMAQMEEESKYKDRKCSKSPIVCKEKRVSKSPSFVGENEVSKHQEEAKYKRRDVEDHMPPVVHEMGQQLIGGGPGGTMPKQSVPSPHDRSMGVYTPDSVTNSVHSVHGYGPYDMDASHLNIESPNSISSNDMNSSAGEPTRPPSTTLPMHEMYINPPQQATMFALQQLQQSHPIHGLPQIHGSSQPVTSHGKSQNSRKSQSSVNHHNHHRSKSVSHQHGNNLNNNALHRSTTPTVTNPHSPINTFVASTTSGGSSSSMAIHRSTPPTVNHQTQSRHHQISYSHSHHPVMAQSGFLGVSQMPSVSYPPNVPVTTVIQHRMTASEPPQTQQRLGSSPCSTSASGLYMHPTMHSVTPACSASSSPGACSGRLQNTQAAGVHQCSLSKLQQLTNGLDMLPPSHGGPMTPPSPINLTPPSSSHSPMTTPPMAHQVLQPNYKLMGNIASSSPVTLPCTTSSPSSSSNRSSRGSHHTSGSNSSVSRSGMSANMAINPMMRYGSSPYGYQVAGQSSASAQTLSYIANGASPFINQPQIRMMNMAAQNQYAQDPAQNSMYSPYYSSFMR